MRRVPRIATWLLRHIHDEPLAGDLVEEYGGGRSALWFWGQTFAAVLRSGRLPGILEVLREPSAGMLIFAALAICSAALTLVMTLMLAVAEDPIRPGVVPAEWAPGRSIAWFVIVLVFLSLLAAAQFLPGKSRSALKILTAASTVAAAYCLVLIVTSLIAPATIVKPGDGYCIELSCIGVQSANRSNRGHDVVVTVNLRIFSDAKSATKIARGPSFYMVDERGRRFPSVSSFPAVLTFVVPHDAQHLFLTEDLQANAHDPWFTRLYLGADFSLFHKHWLLQVA